MKKLLWIWLALFVSGRVKTPAIIHAPYKKDSPPNPEMDLTYIFFIWAFPISKEAVLCHWFTHESRHTITILTAGLQKWYVYIQKSVTFQGDQNLTASPADVFFK